MRLTLLTILIVFINTVHAAHSLYGYAQIDYSNTNDESEATGFQIRRINLINEFQTSQNIRLLADIEYEKGLQMASGEEGQGEILISRGFIEYHFNGTGKIQIGKILTPFGIYNEVHDFSATYLPVDVPQMYQTQKIGNNDEQRFFPKYLTGITYFGTTDPLKNSVFEYSFTLANGDETKEGLDNNKSTALALRGSYKNMDNDFQFGFSGTREKKNKGIAGALGKFQNTYGIDFQIEGERIIWQLEGLYSQFEKADGTNQEALFGNSLLGFNFSSVSTLFVEYSHGILNLKTSDVSSREYILGYVKAIQQSLFFKGQISSHKEYQKRDFYTLKLSTSIAF